METQPGKPMGGYHGLELPFFDENIDKAIIKTNSARSALKVILSAVSARKLWLPVYICDAVVDAVKDVGVEIEFYKINKCFDVDASVNLGACEYILIVDYFGMSGGSVDRSLKRFGHANTIVDCSQAYFSEYTGALATIWSPRKFFGLPDGGLLYSDDPRIKDLANRDTTSPTRMTHLISRLINGPEMTYMEYKESEQAIAESPALGMSHLTERLLYSVDSQGAKARRIQNAHYLHDRLVDYNQLSLDFRPDAAPLCYPLLPSVNTATRSELINHRIFVPTYWPEVLSRVKEGSFEWDLVTNGLFLPCDQRCTLDDMKRLLDLLAAN